MISGIRKNHQDSLGVISGMSTNYSSPEKSRESMYSVISLSASKKARTGSVDCIEPETLKLSRIISRNRKRRISQDAFEHANELKHLKRRISEIGNVIDI